MADEMNQEGVVTTDERQVRRARRQALLDAGINPYPIKSNVTHKSADLEAAHAELEPGADSGQKVCVAGRIRALRRQGKIVFCVIQDAKGMLQLFCRAGVLDEAGFDLLAQLDLGDIVEAEGNVVRTRRGELSVAPLFLRLLSKSCRPLPEKFHGLSDKETRYRQRYVDLVMNEDVRQTFIARSRIISAFRSYMEEQGYLEVETPILQEILGGANARPFITHFNALNQECYLRIATELHLKRLLVGGFEKVFELGRIFRNEGMDLTHNPEFTSMEAYCAYSDLEGMKRLAEGLIKAGLNAVCGTEVIQYQGQTIDCSGTWRSAPMTELVSEVVGVTLTLDTPVEELRALLDEHSIEWEPSWQSGRLVYALYDELVEGSIVQPTFVCDYPVEVSPLAKRLEEDPRLTDRFELIIAGHEYANAFSELNDPVDQEGRFIEQMEAKAAGDEEAMEHDADYIRALEYGMPPAGGIGFGIDRLVMLMTDQASIRDVLLFPHMRPEKGSHVASTEPSQESASQAEEAKRESADAKTSEDANESKGADMPESQAADYSGKLDAGISREKAFELLQRYNKDDFHIVHAETLEGIMRYFAKQHDPENVDFWGLVGLLHDLDWEAFPADEHTVATARLLEEEGVNPLLIRAIQSHNSDVNQSLPKPEHVMEKTLFACDELSGLIGAAVAMRPSGSIMDFGLKSLKKKFKTKSFAAGCDREVIKMGADMLGLELDELFQMTIDAMKSFAPDRDGS